MPTLSSLLVQREVATMRTVEEAIARQVLHGGDLATNLLELQSMHEDALLWILAECVALEPAPSGKLPPPTAAALRLVPGELALRHGFMPLKLDGRTLSIATSEPLSPAIEEDLGFALDVELRQLAAPLVRVRQAIAEHYGIPLDRRFLRLVAKLEGRADPSPSSMPPPLRGPGPVYLPRPASVPPPTFGTGVPHYARATPPPQVASKTPVVAPPPDAHPGLTLDALTPLSPTELAASRPVRIATMPAFQAIRAPTPPPPAPPPPSPAPPLAGEAAPTAATPAAKAPAAGKRALAGWAKSAASGERNAASRRERRKGPLTAAAAEHELDEADARDAILDVYFDFASQFFEYSALFTVQGDIAEGRDACGTGADREKVTGIGVPLDLPSTLALARARKAPVVARFGGDGLDADLLRDLARAPKAGAPSAARVVIPVVVRNRCVAMLYGDDGAAPVELPAIGDVLAFTGLVPGAFERIILRKKLGAFKAAESNLPRARISAPVPKADPRLAAAALARAFEAPSRAPGDAAHAVEQAPTKAPIVAQVSPGARSVRAPANAPLPSVPRSSAPEETPPAEQDDGEDIYAVIARAAESSSANAAYSSPPYSHGSSTSQFGVGQMPDKSRPLSESDLVDAGWGPLPEAPRGRAPSSSRAAVGETVLIPEPTPIARGARASDVAAAKGAAGGHVPSSPPSNVLPATAAPIAVPLAPGGRKTARPIPREEADEPMESSPGGSALVAAMDAPTPSDARVEPPDLPGDAQARAPAGSLPSVIVDIEAEYGALLQTFMEGGPAGDAAFAELVKHAEQVMPHVIARFPGPLRVDRHRARDQLPAASQCGPILELVVAARRVALPFVTVRSSSQDADVRFWATHVLGELRYPEASNAIVPRLFDDDVAVRRIARRSAAALVNAGSAGKPILQGLDHMTRNSDEPIARRVMAIETMGEIRVGAMVPPLIAVLGDPSEEVGETARKALLLITRQDHGRETRRWLEWWAKLGSRNRLEWLIDALMHETPAIRRAAGDELKQLTKEYFGYYDDLPKKERERAQARYREWWDREGRDRFR